jgi:hypothetical protein
VGNLPGVGRRMLAERLSIESDIDLASFVSKQLRLSPQLPALASDLDEEPVSGRRLPGGRCKRRQEPVTATRESLGVDALGADIAREADVRGEHVYLVALQGLSRTMIMQNSNNVSDKSYLAHL